jgi:hypothetical protein
VDLIKQGKVTPKEIGGAPWPLDDLIRVRPVPNLKADFNDKMHSPISIKLIEETHAWPEAAPAERAALFDLAKNRALGMFWFLANDPELPQWVRDGMGRYGLPNDEFVPSDNWTPVLYIREGRRLRGLKTFTQQDAEKSVDGHRAKLHTDSVAICDYSLNSHGTHHAPDGSIAGAFSRSVSPIQIPYGCMVPEEVDGLLVSVGISTSHIGYTAIRYEPAWTALGQAAGLAAAQAVRDDIDLRDVSVRDLQRTLHARVAFTVYVSDVPSSSPYFKAAQLFGTLGFFHELDDTASAPGFFEGPPLEIACQWRKKL